MTKLLNFCFVFVVLCGVFEKSHGTELNCKFHDWTYYTCKVTSLDNTNSNMVITGYSGTPDKNVKAISIYYTNTKYIPKDLGLLFNLTALNIQSSQLVEIKSEDFNNMKHLVELYLSENLLEEIPNGVFSNNPELKTINLYKNKIKFLGSSVFDGLTKLDFVDLESNICINKEYEGIEAIIQLKNDIKIKCINPNENGTMYPIEILFAEIKYQISRVTKELLTEFVAGTEEHHEKLIEMLTEELDESDEDWF